MKKHTYTNNNLNQALSGEALSLVKYTLWGEKAEAEGYPEISECYRVAARNELSRARIWMDELGLNGSLNENLQNSVNEEREKNERFTMYAVDAENEGFDQLKNKFLDTSVAIENQMNVFSNLNSRLVSDEMFISENENSKWRCYNCGFVSKGEAPPSRCPLCSRNETWFSKIE